MIKKEEKVALITGATSGIGEAFARRFAKEGYNLIVTGRRKEKINNLADELREKRFLERAADRNQSLNNAYKHWAYVKEAGKKYVKPSRNDSDIIINGNADLTYFSQIIEYVHTITNNFL